MRNELASLIALLLLLCSSAVTAQYRAALPGYRYEFPRDHFNHPDFQTEWWYYTGNLQSTDGRRFGFELTFFRQATDRNAKPASTWDVRDLYVAHLALSDLDGGCFYHTERANRAGPGIAGIDQRSGRIWNGNWRIQWQGEDQQLDAFEERFAIHLTMHSAKPPVIHGENGVSQKADGPGHASHYISLTRLLTSGQIELAGAKFQVTGLAWMDHEFFTSQLAADQVGWDWLSLQLDDNTELMLFDIRRKNGSIDPHSSGTFVDARGQSRHFSREEFHLEPIGEEWTSPVTHAPYPLHWKIVVPNLNLELDATTPLASQELSGKNKLIPNYWEGAIRLAGHTRNAPITGVGYLEMTGYDRALTDAPEVTPPR